MVPVVGALSGAVTGALAASALLWATASSKAEREERGRKRVDARRDALRAVNEFDTAVRMHRQLLYRREPTDDNLLETAAVRFAGEMRHVAAVLPRRQRRAMVRRARKLVGPGYWREAELRPQGQYDRLQTDAVTLAAIADTRPAMAKSRMTADLLSAPPTDARWDQLSAALASLRKRI